MIAMGFDFPFLPHKSSIFSHVATQSSINRDSNVLRPIPNKTNVINPNWRCSFCRSHLFTNTTIFLFVNCEKELRRTLKSSFLQQRYKPPLYCLSLKIWSSYLICKRVTFRSSCFFQVVYLAEAKLPTRANCFFQEVYSEIFYAIKPILGNQLKPLKKYFKFWKI